MNKLNLVILRWINFSIKDWNKKTKKKQLKAIADETDIKSKIDVFYVYLTPEAVSLIKEIKSTGDNVDYDKLPFCRW